MGVSSSVYPLCVLGQVTHFLLVRALGMLVAISQDSWEGGKGSCGAAPSTVAGTS